MCAPQNTIMLKAKTIAFSFLFTIAFDAQLGFSTLFMPKRVFSYVHAALFSFIQTNVLVVQTLA